MQRRATFVRFGRRRAAVACPTRQTLGRTATTSPVTMDLEINPASSDLLQRVSSQAFDVARLVSSVLNAEALPISAYNLDVAADDPFAIDFTVFKCRSLSYESGISIAVKIQDALRERQFFGWRVRTWIQPESEELVLDFVVWLVIDVVRVTEYRGGRLVEMFNDFGEFKRTCWG